MPPVRLIPNSASKWSYGCRKHVKVDFIDNDPHAGPDIKTVAICMEIADTAEGFVMALTEPVDGLAVGQERYIVFRKGTPERNHHDYWEFE